MFAPNDETAQVFPGSESAPETKTVPAVAGL